MIDLLVNIHAEVIKSTPEDFGRYLINEINWDNHAVCLSGDRGTGKTTLMCQHLLRHYQSAQRALYISADNINVLSFGLFNIAQQYFALGGEALFIDEVHKYPDWSIEIKNILDTYKQKKIIFSASSSLNLKKSKADLSRRVVYYPLIGLSFREFLKFNKTIDIQPLTLHQIIKQHVQIAEKLQSITILKHFKNYLEHGYYPFYLEGEKDFPRKLNNVIEKVIDEDIAICYNLKQSTLPLLKKILWLISSSQGLIPNIDKISRNIGASREAIYSGFDYLERAGLINTVRSKTKGFQTVRKPGKVFINNTNLIFAINTTLKLPHLIGNIRETFFVNQLNKQHKLLLHPNSDFMVDDLIFEIGGNNKDFHQLKNQQQGYLAIDDIEVGFGKKIPLYLFGLLY